MTTTQTDTDVILSDTEVELLNDARSLLDHLGKRCARHDGPGYGGAHALAEAAADAIFNTLNWMDSRNVQCFTDEVLFNRSRRVQS